MSLLLRRNFVTAFLGAAASALAVSVLYPVVRFLSPPRIPEATGDRVLAGKVSDLARDRWKIFPFGSEPGILVEGTDGRLVAFSAACTHLGCTVQFDAPSKRIWCACHNGWYDLEGKNVAGPPPRPLTAYKVQVVGDEIFVTRG
ncbi:MAG TPA: Rieske (2Fe-2S) protein [Candidatus Polarisedimenticolaceae bacterium]|nr:Rieske (2Fe-2S) protein [Candidatus Polarisedimenticolaceae bacterium]